MIFTPGNSSPVLCGEDTTKKALYSRTHFFTFLLLGVLLGMCFVVKAPKAQAASSAGVSLLQQYHELGQSFWNAEKQLQQRDDSFSLYKPIYLSPLSQNDVLYQKYFDVGETARVYIESIDQAKRHSWTVPPAVYLGGLAAFTIGDYTSAQKYFSRLLKEFPNYKRDLYINDRYAPNPDFAQPVKPGVTKLLFYCQIANRGSGVPPEKAALSTGETPEPHSLLAFQQFNQTALKVLSTQKDFAYWLAHRPYRSQRRSFWNETYGETPDQMRATVLPKTSQLIKDGWQQLFPAALKKSGALKMREYLRELMQSDSLLKEIAAPRLMEVDQLVIKYYFARAKALLGKHNFDATRKMYKRIIAEYPSSPAAKRAEEELPRTIPVAVNYYQTVATKNFHPAGNIGVPQNKASL